MLTGSRPKTTNVYHGDHHCLKTSVNRTTIPGLFKCNSYQTLSFGKIFDTTTQNQVIYDQELWSAPAFQGVANFESLNERWKAIPDTLLQTQLLIDEQRQWRTYTVAMAVGYHKLHLLYVFPVPILKYYTEDKNEVPSGQYAPAGLPPIAWYMYQAIKLTPFADMTPLDLSLAENWIVPDLTIKGL